MITANKGDWSEIYALFKLLSDGELTVGDASLNKIEEIFYPIIKIIRKERFGNFEYELSGNLVIISGGAEQLKIPIQTFTDQSVKLLSEIKAATGAFSIPEIEEFMTSIHCYSVKAKNTTKTDIRIVIQDTKYNRVATLGFSIKSELGGDSSLLNAGHTTNFIYRVDSVLLGDKQISDINQIDTRSKIKDRIIEIKKLGGELTFQTLERDVFKNNLVLIDSLLPNILAEIIKVYFTTKLNSVKDLTECLNLSNPLNYDNQHKHTFYEYKMKRFLTDIALGMTPNNIWGGLYDATGGFLIVKESGDVLCYHIYNRNEFEDYLFKNTRLETASSTRHGFGKIYKNGANLFFNLNLQVRFIT